MKQLKYWLIIMCFSTGLFSCKKSFLDVQDDTYLLREQYVKDLKTLQQYLNGIYVLMTRDFYSGQPSGGGGSIPYADIVADNIKPTSGNTNILIAHYAWNQSIIGGSNNVSNMNNLWQNGYYLARSCSYVIEKAQGFKSENPAKADQMRGEAYAIRALAHSVLVSVFAQAYNFTPDASHPGIPYITSWDWNDAARRNTVKEVYDSMIEDLQAAISLLPASNNKKTTMNQLAAKALLARIYLYKEDWQRAKEMAEEVSSAVPLLPAAKYPAKLFTREETEALFQLVPSSENIISSSYTTAFPGVHFRFPYFLAAKDIADLLTQNPNDSRSQWIRSGGSGRDSVRKYPSNVVPGFGTGINPHRSYFHTLFRSSEMFLTVAEASAMLNDEATARQYLDAIRQRADPSANNTTATGTALRDSIYLERRKELAFEGFRMWDLLRWKQGVNRTDANIGAPLVLPYPSDHAISPIPQPDVDYGMAQNPSY